MSSDTLVHMVGSVPLDDAESVYRTLSGTVGSYMKRMPDGETGRRRRWISFINDQLKDHPDFEIDDEIPVIEFRQSNGGLSGPTAKVQGRDRSKIGDLQHRLCR